jgi:hypothetical protein
MFKLIAMIFIIINMMMRFVTWWIIVELLQDHQTQGGKWHSVDRSQRAAIYCSHQTSWTELNM